MGYILLGVNRITTGKNIDYSFILYNTNTDVVGTMVMKDIRKINVHDRLNWGIKKQNSSYVITENKAGGKFKPSLFIDGVIVEKNVTLISMDRNYKMLTIANGKDFKRISIEEYMELRKRGTINNERLEKNTNYSTSSYVDLSRVIKGWDQDETVILSITGNDEGEVLILYLDGTVKPFSRRDNQDKSKKSTKAFTVTPQINNRGTVQSNTQNSAITQDVAINKIEQLEGEKAALIKNIEELTESLEFEKQRRTLEVDRLQSKVKEQEKDISKLRGLLDCAQRDIERANNDKDDAIRQRDEAIKLKDEQASSLADRNLKLELVKESEKRLNKELERLKALRDTDDILIMYQRIIWNAYPYDRITVPVELLESLKAVLIEIIDKSDDSIIGLYRIKKTEINSFTIALIHTNKSKGTCMIQVLGQMDIEEKKPNADISVIKRNYNAWLRSTKFIKIGDNLV